ncbi:PAS domain-containing protein [Parerythrobacter aestuarii]|uniref:PAS domain-containing protein n=1 Tax=Parerythrobacter aestuarii TaxID=3020909 RepID=UPI00389B2A1D
MDTLRGQFGSFDDDTRDEDYESELEGDEIGREAPPSPVGQDERRMQVRAYNHWASLLQDRNFPSIEDLNPEELPDFGPYSVLLDFTTGIENPAVQYLGDELGEECGTDGSIRTLEDVPSRSLLSRITDHYMQILANQAPIGFEAEFVNQRGATILYRGILLPFSSDDDTIDFIYGVINWKEVADQLTTDELLLEIDQALEENEDSEAGHENALGEVDVPEADPVSEWAEGPVAEDETAQAAEECAEPADEAGGEDQWSVSADERSVPDESFGSLLGSAARFDDDEFDGDDDDEPIAEFTLPDIGDADEEDTIDHTAYASLAPAGEDEDDGPSLTGLRSKPAKKPLDLSLASALEPMPQAEEPDPVGEPDEVEDLPTPAFGQEDDRFASLMGGDYTDEPVEEDTDDWSAPLDLDPADALPVEEPASDEPDRFEVPASIDVPVAEHEDDEPVAATPAEAVEEAPVEEIPAEEIPVEEMVTEPVAEKPPTEIVLPSFGQDDHEMGLYDTLADARELAQIASTSEERSRSALYDAVGRAFDVSLAAEEAPEDFAELVAENGLTMQDRAPMTPIVKLVFGADYDKTRVAEYASVLSHAHRVGIERGELSGFLAKADGGLKGVVQAERRLRREEEGKEVAPATEVRPALAKKLRKLELHQFDELDPDGPEFGVVVIRRLENGEIALLGDLSDEVALVEKVARKLLD